MNDAFLPEELRLFIACELPEAWTGALREVVRELQKRDLPRLRWVRPEGIHLTLKFLGEAGRHMLPDLREALELAATGVEPFALQLANLGSFGGRNGVRILWAGVAGDLKALKSLHARVDHEAHERGFAREVRPYSAHLTLARVPDDTPRESGAQIGAALRAVRLPEAGPFLVRELCLMRSQVGAGGAIYSRLATASFGLSDLSHSAAER